MAARKVRIYQEDWLPFQNLPAAVAAFERATGIGVELAWDKVGVGTIEHMFDQMARSFGDDDPPFDLVCMDEVHAARLRAARPGAGARRLDGARRDHPRRLHARHRRGRDLRRRLHRPALRQRQQHAALPPRPARPLRPAGARLLGRAEAGRLGTPGGRAPRYRPRLLGLPDPRRRRRRPFGLDHRLVPGLVRRALAGRRAPAGAGHRGQGRGHGLLRRPARRRGTAGPGRISASSRCAAPTPRAASASSWTSAWSMPTSSRPTPSWPRRAASPWSRPGRRGARPTSTRRLWAIPKASPVAAEAWELAKWLCSPRQLLEDGLRSNALETAPLSVLYSPEFDRHFRADILAVARASRAIAREERPFGDLGIEACTIVGDTTHELLLGRWTPRERGRAHRRTIEPARHEQLRTRIMEHKGRTALVTGGTGGLGVVECEALAREGANVLMLDVKEGHKADEINAVLPADAGKVRFIACDLVNPQATKDLAVQLDAEVGGIDILINNAAINPLKPIDAYDLAEWQKVQDVNATAAVALAMACVPSMKRKGWGQIINICSVTLNGGWADFTSYVGSKGTLLGLTRAMARELGQFGIRVNAVSPGAIPTALEREVWADQLETYVKFLVDHQALKYRGSPEDIANAILYPDLGQGALHHRPEPRRRRRLVDALSVTSLDARGRRRHAGLPDPRRAWAAGRADRPPHPGRRAGARRHAAARGRAGAGAGHLAHGGARGDQGAGRQGADREPAEAGHAGPARAGLEPARPGRAGLAGGVRAVARADRAPGRAAPDDRARRRPPRRHPAQRRPAAGAGGGAGGHDGGGRRSPRLLSRRPRLPPRRVRGLGQPVRRPAGGHRLGRARGQLPPAAALADPDGPGPRHARARAGRRSAPRDADAAERAMDEIIEEARIELEHATGASA